VLGPGIVRFGDYEADLGSGELRKGGRKVRLQERPFQILAILLEQPGEIVTREAFSSRLWPANTFVDFDHSLNSSIKKLRDALGDDADHPLFVETLGGRGYRFIAPLRGPEPAPARDLRPVPALAVVAEPAPAAPDEPAAPTRASRTALSGRSLTLFLVVLVVLLGLVVGHNAVEQQRQRKKDRLSQSQTRSIAVLPLENLSNDPAQEFFADGMTDELITQLARLRSLRVISRRSIIRYRGTKESVPQIARELGVDVIVEGSVARAGDRIRINVQVIDAATDHHMWARSYERDLRDVLALQGEVARAIVTEAPVARDMAELTRASAISPVSAAMYESYLKGLYYIGRETEEGLRQGVEHLKAALQVEPEYAPAWAALADAYYYLSNVYVPPAQAMPLARAAAERALKIDDTLASAHTSLGLVQLYYDRNLQAAERELSRAIALTPNDGTAHLWYGMYWALRRRPENSLPELKLAQQLDPLSPQTRTNVGLALFFVREYDQAVAFSRESLKLDPGSWGAYASLAGALEGKGEIDQAIVSWRQASDLSGSPVMLSCLGHAYAVAGDRPAAGKVLSALSDRSKREFVPAHAFATVYVGLGDREQTLAWLEKAYRDNSESFVELGADSRFDPLRSDSRFVALLRRVGLE
jgi:TolB-like protein/DNA-binding winged helix-turn-helix (wHTH) protein/Flp pilus assembly protein TadD